MTHQSSPRVLETTVVAGELSGSAAVAVWAVAVPKGSPGSALSGIAVFYCGTLLAFSRLAAVTALQLINLNTSTHFTTF